MECVHGVPINDYSLVRLYNYSLLRGFIFYLVLLPQAFVNNSSWVSFTRLLILPTRATQNYSGNIDGKSLIKAHEWRPQHCHKTKHQRVPPPPTPTPTPPSATHHPTPLRPPVPLHPCAPHLCLVARPSFGEQMLGSCIAEAGRVAYIGLKKKCAD